MTDEELLEIIMKENQAIRAMIILENFAKAILGDRND